MLKELVKLSNRLDNKGLMKEATFLDSIIIRIAEESEESEESEGSEESEESEESEGSEESEESEESEGSEGSEGSEESSSYIPSSMQEMVMQSNSDLDRDSETMNPEDFEFLTGPLLEAPNPGEWLGKGLIEYSKEDGSSGAGLIALLDNARNYVMSQHSAGETSTGADAEGHGAMLDRDGGNIGEIE
jgi:hypothetical protein